MLSITIAVIGEVKETESKLLVMHLRTRGVWRYQ
jgi:hypothetical protein